MWRGHVEGACGGGMWRGHVKTKKTQKGENCTRSGGSPLRSLTSSQLRYMRVTSRSQLTKVKQPTSVAGPAVAWQGFSFSTRTAKFSTPPDFTTAIGIQSVHPPLRISRAGSSTLNSFGGESEPPLGNGRGARTRFNVHFIKLLPLRASRARDRGGCWCEYCSI